MESIERQIDAKNDDCEMVVVINEPISVPEDGSEWPTVLCFIDAQDFDQRYGTVWRGWLAKDTGWLLQTYTIDRGAFFLRSQLTWLSPARLIRFGDGSML